MVASQLKLIIMDKVSKRSKGYAFVEYITEEAANAAIREMNGVRPRFDVLYIIIY